MAVEISPDRGYRNGALLGTAEQHPDTNAHPGSRSGNARV